MWNGWGSSGDARKGSIIPLSGYLWKMKRSQSMLAPAWNKRWFTVEDDHLNWYKAKGQPSPSGRIPLLSITRIKRLPAGESGMHSFSIKSTERSLLLRAQTPGEAGKWVSGVELQINLRRGGTFLGPPTRKNAKKVIKSGDNLDVMLTKVNDMLERLDSIRADELNGERASPQGRDSATDGRSTRRRDTGRISQRAGQQAQKGSRSASEASGDGGGGGGSGRGGRSRSRGPGNGSGSGSGSSWSSHGRSSSGGSPNGDMVESPTVDRVLRSELARGDSDLLREAEEGHGDGFPGRSGSDVSEPPSSRVPSRRLEPPHFGTLSTSAARAHGTAERKEEIIDLSDGEDDIMAEWDAPRGGATGGARNGWLDERQQNHSSHARDRSHGRQSRSQDSPHRRGDYSKDWGGVDRRDRGGSGPRSAVHYRSGRWSPSPRRRDRDASPEVDENDPVRLKGAQRDRTQRSVARSDRRRGPRYGEERSEEEAEDRWSAPREEPRQHHRQQQSKCNGSWAAARGPGRPSPGDRRRAKGHGSERADDGLKMWDFPADMDDGAAGDGESSRRPTQSKPRRQAASAWAEDAPMRM